MNPYAAAWLVIVAWFGGSAGALFALRYRIAADFRNGVPPAAIALAAGASGVVGGAIVAGPFAFVLAVLWVLS